MFDAIKRKQDTTAKAEAVRDKAIAEAEMNKGK